MKRLAVFVEGLTELTFLRSLIEELVGKKHLIFEVRRQIRGRLHVLEVAAPATGDTRFYVLLVNCQNDERVKSEILMQRESLIRVGYDLVIGLRDLHPNTLAELSIVESRLKSKVPTKDLQIEIFLAVAEVEAWFVQESSHFPRIHSDFTPEFISHETGFNVATDRADTIECPSSFLHTVYSKRGLAYRKRRAQIGRTVEALDYANLYLETAHQLPHSKRLVDALDAFFSPAAAQSPAL